jgi:hypothetical protein
MTENSSKDIKSPVALLYIQSKYLDIVCRTAYNSIITLSVLRWKWRRRHPQTQDNATEMLYRNL